MLVWQCTSYTRQDCGRHATLAYQQFKVKEIHQMIKQEGKPSKKKPSKYYVEFSLGAAQFSTIPFHDVGSSQDFSFQLLAGRSVLTLQCGLRFARVDVKN